VILLNTDRTELAVSLEHNSGGVLVMRLAPGFPVATEVSAMAQILTKQTYRTDKEFKVVIMDKCHIAIGRLLSFDSS